MVRIKQCPHWGGHCISVEPKLTHQEEAYFFLRAVFLFFLATLRFVAFFFAAFFLAGFLATLRFDAFFFEDFFLDAIG
jgi:hypothetical protein